jgi:hypothetical protein
MLRALSLTQATDGIPMKTRWLTALLWTMLSCAVAYGQSSDGFPNLSQVPGTKPLVDNPGQTEFTFIAAGDNRPSGGKIKQPKTLSEILNDSKQFKPSFIIWSGDIIGGFRIAGKPMDRSHLEKQYAEFFRIAKTADVPVFNSPGNHEMDRVDKVEKPEKGTIETPDEKMEKLYLEVMNFPSGAPPYGAFNYGNSRFIAVDTEEVPKELTLRSEGKTVAKKLKLDPGFVSPKQIELLKTDLEANRHKAHIFVFMHHPINPAKPGSRLNKDNADELEKIFAKYKNVSYVIAAHEHIYYYFGGKSLTPPRKIDKPVYLVSGGAGAPLDRCPSKSIKNCRAAYHYLVFTVTGDDVDVKLMIVPVPLTKTSHKEPQKAQ